MLPAIPQLHEYDISEQYGFLSPELPLEQLPDPYYQKWETIAANLQALILSRRLRQVVDKLPILSATGLQEPGEWRRACVLLAFMVHGYIWGGDIPREVCRYHWPARRFADGCIASTAISVYSLSPSV